MTEEELRKKINDCDRQIVSTYEKLRSAARLVGSKGYEAAQRGRRSAISVASSEKTKSTLMPLIISVIGFFLCAASGFLGVAMIIGGIALAYYLNQKANEELRSVETSHNQIVHLAESQQKTLNSILDNSTKI